jgi:hypothetical protein
MCQLWSVIAWVGATHHLLEHIVNVRRERVVNLHMICRVASLLQTDITATRLQYARTQVKNSDPFAKKPFLLIIYTASARVVRAIQHCTLSVNCTI